MEIKLKRLTKTAILPKHATEESAGYDLYADVQDGLLIRAGETKKVPIGIAIALARGTAGFVYARSGLSTKHGLAPANCVGVIDSDYRGELMVPLYNHSSKDYMIAPGERIAQLIVAATIQLDFVETDTLPDSERGESGFGSTGKVDGGTEK